MWRKTSEAILGSASAKAPEKDGGGSDAPEPATLFALQHTGQPPPPEVRDALRIVVKSGLLKKVHAPLVVAEQHAMDEVYRGKLLRVMDCLNELNCKASPEQQAKLVHIAHTLIAMETYFAARPNDNSSLIGMLKCLRPECLNPPKVAEGGDAMKYDATSHMKEIKLCFDQLLEVSSVKSSGVCDKFAFPLFKVGEFNFAKVESVQMLADSLRNE
eukprot:158145-Rhodomonas_salina.1